MLVINCLSTAEMCVPVSVMTSLQESFRVNDWENGGSRPSLGTFCFEHISLHFQGHKIKSNPMPIIQNGSNMLSWKVKVIAYNVTLVLNRLLMEYFVTLCDSGTRKLEVPF